MSWPLVALCELGDFRAGFGFPIKFQGKSAGEIPFAKVGDISSLVRSGGKYIYSAGNYLTKAEIEEIKAKTIPTGSIVFAKIGEAIRQNFRAITSGEFVIDNNTMAFVPNLEKVDLSYLYYFMCGLDLYRYTAATTVPALRKSVLETIQIPLPPLETQKQIAVVLEKADQLRKDCQQMEQELNSLAQSVFIDMFGDPVSNPKGWNESSFSKLVKNIQGGQSPKCNTHPAKDNEWGVLKLSALKGGAYKPHENKAILEDSTPNTSIEVKAGDLLFTRKNTYELVGSCAYVTDTPNKLMLPDLIFRFEMPDHLKIYVWGLFNSREFKQTIKNLASGAAGSMPNISKTRLNDLLLPIPDAEEILKYTKIITTIWQQLDLLHQAQHEYEATFNALMQKAFKGELNLDRSAA